MRRLIQRTQKALARIRIHMHPIHLLGMRPPQLSITDTRFRIPAARPLRLQARGLTSPQHIRKRFSNSGVARELTMRNLGVIGTRTRQLRTRERHRPVAMPSDCVHEPILLPRHASNRFLPHTDNVRES
jgi:hypothetical protein